ncbi:PREDICTED: uncharacterized protein LOC108369140 [Rhagoletis zephyria]|uniref:uncharacterized protein LOC108369140 n=1 Tax=Rhagoletis zephyria TaxID=28612 RepID=UPI000811A131|nr:PREDICTED: uncharacterized protein LOC108369140 [Rhagoletis zephyria]
MENEVIRGQLKIVMETLADQSVYLKRLLREKEEKLSLQSNFPIKLEDDLQRINQEVSKNMNQYVFVMKMLLKSGIQKSLKNIIADELVLEYNVDGVQGKKSLKNHANFYNALLASIPISEGPPEEQLRKSLSLQKKRIFKNVCIQKSKMSSNI